MEDLLHSINGSDQNVRHELNTTVESLENETKIFEDLEFQYLEEETEWLAYREEVHHGLRTLTASRDEKLAHIQALETQTLENHQTACTDTRTIEKDLWRLISDLEKRRELLKELDRRHFELSGGQPTTTTTSPSESDDEGSGGNSKRQTMMSQSLFGSQEIISTRSRGGEDLMSKSVNENLFHNSNAIEMLSPFTSSTPVKRTNQRRLLQPIDVSEDVTRIAQRDHENLRQAEQTATNERNEANGTDAMSKLKYNLSPPFQHKITKDTNIVNEVDDDDDDDDNAAAAADDDDMAEFSKQQQQQQQHEDFATKANLNLSIESDDFEVNPLERRVPSQDDIDRISKVQLDAPISTQGASDKVIESIKEIERNRQLLLTQQGKSVACFFSGAP